MRLFFLLLICFHSVYASKHQVMIGHTKVIIQKVKNGKGKAFIHLHQNETTALHAAKSVVRDNGGSLLTLIHPGARNIVFQMHHKRYEFDPNRIFTDNGIKKTLRQYGNYSPEAAHEIKKLANRITVLLPKGKIIAVHNNRTYSLKNYFPGHDSVADAQALHVNPHGYHRNFYLVTKKNDYLRLKQSKFNSIWQAHDAKDDGSLSVFLSERNYINVEAGYNQLAAQIKMLKEA
jgi:hypothetical protein